MDADAGGSGVLLSDACADNGLQLMRLPPDLDAAFRKFIPPFGAAGNPVVASLVGDVEVEEAGEYLFERGIPAYPDTTEMPVVLLGAKYRWARSAGLL